MSYIFGKKPILDLIKNNKQDILCVFLISNNNSLINECKFNKIKFEIKDKKFFNKFNKNLNHQFSAALIKDKKHNSLSEYLSSFNKEKAIFLIIDSIEDPQNFGAILRTCDAMNVDGVIYKKNNQTQINDLVIKSSMGAINNLNLFKVNNLTESIELLKKNGFWIYASCLDKGSKPINNIKFDKKTCLIVGNENKGISRLLIEKSDFKISIPMLGSVQSLNVSVATGILLFTIVNNQE